MRLLTVMLARLEKQRWKLEGPAVLELEPGDARLADELKEMDLKARAQAWKECSAEVQHALPIYEICAEDCRAVFASIVGMVKGAEDAVCSIEKDELIAAQNGYDKRFEKMDANTDGHVTESEWCAFFRSQFDEKGRVQGGKWLMGLLITLQGHVAEHTAQEESEFGNVISYRCVREGFPPNGL